MKSRLLTNLCCLALFAGATSVYADSQRAVQAVPEPEPIIRDLRAMMLGLQPTDIGLPEKPMHPKVWGVMMDIGYQNTLATMVVLADGTTSLYLGHGGGVIGAGQYQDVRSAAEEVLQIAELHRGAIDSNTSQAPPNVGEVKFHLLTYDGPLTIQVSEQDLGHNQHRLSAMFHAGHEVIARMTAASEVRQIAGM